MNEWKIFKFGSCFPFVTFHMWEKKNLSNGRHIGPAQCFLLLFIDNQGVSIEFGEKKTVYLSVWPSGVGITSFLKGLNGPPSPREGKCANVDNFPSNPSWSEKYGRRGLPYLQNNIILVFSHHKCHLWQLVILILHFFLLISDNHDTSRRIRKKSCWSLGVRILYIAIVLKTFALEVEAAFFLST